jgi:hypothetical protein
MSLNSPITYAKSYATAFEGFYPVQALQGSEQFLGKLHVKAGAIV